MDLASIIKALSDRDKKLLGEMVQSNNKPQYTPGKPQGGLFSLPLVVSQKLDEQVGNSYVYVHKLKDEVYQYLCTHKI